MPLEVSMGYLHPHRQLFLNIYGRLRIAAVVLDHHGIRRMDHHEQLAGNGTRSDRGEQEGYTDTHGHVGFSKDSMVPSN
jgi:hypothetical protein